MKYIKYGKRKFSLWKIKKSSEEVGKKLRDKIVEFARKTLKEVTGKEDIKIYMGKNYNDIPCIDLKETSKKVTFV